MKWFLMTTSLVWFSSSALADGKSESLNPQDLCAGISIQEEVWQLDPTTKSIKKRFGPVNIYRFGAGAERSKLAGESAKDYQCRMGNMSSHNYGDDVGAIHLGIETKVMKDGRIFLEMSQYGDTQRGKRDRKNLDKPLRTELFDISDLRTIQWKSDTLVDKNLLIRLVPMMSVDGAPKEAQEPVVAGRDTILFDDRRNVWTEEVTFGAAFVALRTTQGTIAFSYRPFNGAEAMGDAKGRRLELRLPDGRLLSFLSQSDFLPAGVRYVVYGKFWPERKSDSPGSLGTSESGDREDFEKRLNDAM